MVISWFGFCAQKMQRCFLALALRGREKNGPGSKPTRPSDNYSTLSTASWWQEAGASASQAVEPPPPCPSAASLSSGASPSWARGRYVCDERCCTPHAPLGWRCPPPLSPRAARRCRAAKLKKGGSSQYVLPARYTLPRYSRCLFSGLQSGARLGMPGSGCSPLQQAADMHPCAGTTAAAATAAGLPVYQPALRFFFDWCAAAAVPGVVSMLAMLLRALAAPSASGSVVRPQALPSLTRVAWRVAAMPASSSAAAALLGCSSRFWKLPAGTHAPARQLSSRSSSLQAPTQLQPPTEPDPSECCGRGCAECVWTAYYEDVQQYNAELAALHGVAPPEDPFAALERRLAEQQRQAEQQEQQQDPVAAEAHSVPAAPAAGAPAPPPEPPTQQQQQPTRGGSEPAWQQRPQQMALHGALAGVG